jgi:hypothetical protein
MDRGLDAERHKGKIKKKNNTTLTVAFCKIVTNIVATSFISICHFRDLGFINAVV